jgi:hypothetical protein
MVVQAVACSWGGRCGTVVPGRWGIVTDSITPSGCPVAKPNYAFEKRQRELEKKRKKEETNQRKTPGPGTDDASPAPADDAPAPPAPTTSA